MLRVYKKLDNCELVAICDSDRTKKQLADSYGCNFCEELDQFLKQDLDAVSVCTPTSMHHDVVSSVLDMGKNVLVEKPFADSLIKGDSLVKKSRKSR